MVFMVNKPKIMICLGSSCFARGNERNLQIIEEYLAENGLQDEVDLEFNCSLCQGKCSEGPNVTVNGVRYGNVDKGVMLELLKSCF
jgi:NADH:ubiquinone oxidoreductase subunit E